MNIAPGPAGNTVEHLTMPSTDQASVRLDGDRLIPRVTGTAYVTAEATLLLDPADPFQMGIRV